MDKCEQHQTVQLREKGSIGWFSGCVIFSILIIAVMMMLGSFLAIEENKSLIAEVEKLRLMCKE